MSAPWKKGDLVEASSERHPDERRRYVVHAIGARLDAFDLDGWHWSPSSEFIDPIPLETTPAPVKVPTARGAFFKATVRGVEGVHCFVDQDGDTWSAFPGSGLTQRACIDQDVSEGAVTDVVVIDPGFQ